MKNILCSWPTNACICNPVKPRKEVGNSTFCSWQSFELRHGGTVSLCSNVSDSVFVANPHVYAENTIVHTSGPRLSQPNQALYASNQKADMLSRGPSPISPGLR